MLKRLNVLVRFITMRTEMDLKERKAHQPV